MVIEINLELESMSAKMKFLYEDFGVKQLER